MRILLTGVVRMLQKMVSNIIRQKVVTDLFQCLSLSLGAWAPHMPERSALAATAMFGTNPRSESDSRSYQIPEPQG